jgi:hypothetical protein
MEDFLELLSLILRIPILISCLWVIFLIIYSIILEYRRDERCDMVFNFAIDQCKYGLAFILLFFVNEYLIGKAFY